jgi:hypothetical protein
MLSGLIAFLAVVGFALLALLLGLELIAGFAALTSACRHNVLRLRTATAHWSC